MTSGRYYFAPTSAPHYPALHYYGSNNWQAGELFEDPPLGEPLDLPRPWRNGKAPERLPLAKIVGSAGCLADGATFPVPPPAPVLYDGIDERCYAPGALLTYGALAAIDSPALLAAYARLTELVYNEDMVTVKLALLAWFGPTFGDRANNAAGSLPARFYAKFHDGSYLAFVSGTPDFQLLAEQALVSLIGPQDQGTFSTSSFWNTNANTIIAEINAHGADVTKPIVFVGHSYGAVVAMLIAARYHAWTPTRPVTLVTFGVPKPGDARLVEIVNGVRGVHVSNIEDLVVSLPPNAAELLPLSLALPAGLLAFWNAWARLPSYLVMTPTGTATWGSPAFLTYPILLPLVVAALAGDPQAPITAHDIDQYRARLKLRQPNPAWPVPPAAWAILFP